MPSPRVAGEARDSDRCQARREILTLASRPSVVARRCIRWSRVTPKRFVTRRERCARASSRKAQLSTGSDEDHRSLRHGGNAWRKRARSTRLSPIRSSPACASWVASNRPRTRRYASRCKIVVPAHTRPASITPGSRRHVEVDVGREDDRGFHHRWVVFDAQTSAEQRWIPSLLNLYRAPRNSACLPYAHRVASAEGYEHGVRRPDFCAEISRSRGQTGSRLRPSVTSDAAMLATSRGSTWTDGCWGEHDAARRTTETKRAGVYRCMLSYPNGDGFNGQNTGRM